LAGKLIAAPDSGKPHGRARVRLLGKTKDGAMTDQTTTRRGPLRALYAWMLKNAKGKHAWAALAAFAFAEASFFPCPPDVMLLPMMLADRKHAWHLAGWCALWSVIGGILGYVIGALFWDTAGLWIIHALHVPVEKVQAMRAAYTQHAYLIVLQGITPIPYKLVTIASGLAGVPFALFMLYSSITRSARFLLVEGLLVHFFGEQAQAMLDKYLEIALIVFMAAVVAGIVLVIFVLK
jgi:membrane protein YqaA with SNARE-associated domain